MAFFAFGQRKAFAKILATDVFPIPRDPLKRYAWDTRSYWIAFFSVCTTWVWPTRSSNRLGRHFL